MNKVLLYFCITVVLAGCQAKHTRTDRGLIWDNHSGDKQSGRSEREDSASPEAGQPPAPVSMPGDLYLIDAHSQMDPDVDIERVVSLMDHGGIYRTLLSNHMGRPWTDINDFAKRFPGRIIPAVRVKGPGYFRNDMDRYLRQLMPPIESGTFKALAEVHLWHDSAGGKYMEFKYSFDDPIVQRTLQEAKRGGWPFIIHIEFNSLSRSNYKTYMDGLGSFLQANPDHPFVLIHMAQLEAGPAVKLLAAHQNLHFMTSHASPSYQGGPKPFINMFEGESLKPEWKALIAKYPEASYSPSTTYFPSSGLLTASCPRCDSGGKPSPNYRPNRRTS